MSDCTHIDLLLQDYLDGTLTPDERTTVDAHLRTCASCRAEHDALASVRTAVAALPRDLAPPRDLWPEIEARLAGTLPGDAAGLHQRRNGQTDRPPARRRLRPARLRPWHVAAFVVAAVAAGGALLLTPRLFPETWEVVRLEGAPSIGATPVTDTTRWRRGEWLVTDHRSRAAFNVGAIGAVEVSPDTRVRLLRTRSRDHRLALSAGTIHARIWAPPRLFFVETPSALAIDLGCAYTLHVDSTGGSILHVTSGYVELQYGARNAVVPAGSMCLTRPGLGPGTPFDEDASEGFRRALARFDFEDAAGALTDLLAEARPEDAPTLWRLLYKTAPPDRARLYDGLVALVPPPDGVPREAVLREDLDAIEAWDRHLGLDLDSGWFLRFLKNNKKKR